MLKTDNPEILSFYKDNNIDFEEANLIFVSLLKKLGQKFTNSNESALSNNLLKNLLTKVGNIENNQRNISENISTILTNINNITSSLNEQKMKNLTEFQNLLKLHMDNFALKCQDNNNTLFDKISDKLQILQENNINSIKNNLREIFQEKDDALFNRLIIDISKKFSELNTETSKILNGNPSDDLYKKMDTLIIDKFDSISKNINETILSLLTKSNGDIFKEMEKQYDTFNSMREFFEKKKYCNSSTTGKLGEERLEKILNECFPSSTIINSSSIAKNGDFILERNGRKKIIFENKEYNTNVPDSEITKFIRDIELNKTNGVFLSQTSGIANKKNLEIDIHDGNIIIFLHNVDYNIDMIRSSIEMIDIIENALKLNSNEDCSEKISKNKLEEIRAEYLFFINQKKLILETSKEYNKKITEQIERLEMSNISKLLSKNFSDLDLAEFKCEFCTKSFKNKRALASHYKGCDRKIKKISNTNDIIKINA